MENFPEPLPASTFLTQNHGLSWCHRISHRALSESWEFSMEFSICILASVTFWKLVPSGHVGLYPHITIVYHRYTHVYDICSINPTIMEYRGIVFPNFSTSQRSTGWWYTYPSEKWWSSSVGMIFPFPIWWKVIQNSMVPVTTSQV